MPRPLSPVSRLGAPVRARTGAVLTSMDVVAPYLADATPPAGASGPGSAPRLTPGADPNASTWGMLLVIGVVVAGAALVLGRHS